MGNYELIDCDHAQAVATKPASALLDMLEAAPQHRPFSLALSGGRIAQPFFEAIVKQARIRSRSMENVEFFWADERSVPPQSSESNFKLAWEHLLAPLETPEKRIHRLRGEIAPELAAGQAEAELRGIAPLGDDGQPVLDLIFLGMGEDGHVASLFPNEPEEIVHLKKVYRPVIAQKPPPQRITLGYLSICAAREVWVLVSGPGKEAALKNSLANEGGTPLSRVIRLRNKTRLFTDVAV
jgi:6-phosphogluconolactonase